MDILTGLSQVIDAFWYNILLSVAGLHWSLLRGLIMMGHTVEVINNWLLNNAFAPLIAQTNASLSMAVRFAFLLALLAGAAGEGERLDVAGLREGVVIRIVERRTTEVVGVWVADRGRPHVRPRSR